MDFNLPQFDVDQIESDLKKLRTQHQHTLTDQHTLHTQMSGQKLNVNSNHFSNNTQQNQQSTSFLEYVSANQKKMLETDFLEKINAQKQTIVNYDDEVLQLKHFDYQADDHLSSNSHLGEEKQDNQLSQQQQLTHNEQSNNNLRPKPISSSSSNKIDESKIPESLRPIYDKYIRNVNMLSSSNLNQKDAYENADQDHAKKQLLFNVEERDLQNEDASIFDKLNRRYLEIKSQQEKVQQLKQQSPDGNKQRTTNNANSNPNANTNISLHENSNVLFTTLIEPQKRVLEQQLCQLNALPPEDQHQDSQNYNANLNYKSAQLEKQRIINLQKSLLHSEVRKQKQRKEDSKAQRLIQARNLFMEIEEAIEQVDPPAAIFISDELNLNLSQNQDHQLLDMEAIFKSDLKRQKRQQLHDSNLIQEDQSHKQKPFQNNKQQFTAGVRGQIEQAIISLKQNISVNSRVISRQYYDQFVEFVKVQAKGFLRLSKQQPNPMDKIDKMCTALTQEMQKRNNTLLRFRKQQPYFFKNYARIKYFIFLKTHQIQAKDISTIRNNEEEYKLYTWLALISLLSNVEPDIKIVNGKCEKTQQTWEFVGNCLNRSGQMVKNLRVLSAYLETNPINGRSLKGFEKYCDWTFKSLSELGNSVEIRQEDFNVLQLLCAFHSLIKILREHNLIAIDNEQQQYSSQQHKLKLKVNNDIMNKKVVEQLDTSEADMQLPQYFKQQMRKGFVQNSIKKCGQNKSIKQIEQNEFKTNQLILRDWEGGLQAMQHQIYQLQRHEKQLQVQELREIKLKQKADERAALMDSIDENQKWLQKNEETRQLQMVKSKLAKNEQKMQHLQYLKLLKQEEKTSKIKFDDNKYNINEPIQQTDKNNAQQKQILSKDIHPQKRQIKMASAKENQNEMDWQRAQQLIGKQRELLQQRQSLLLNIEIQKQKLKNQQ